MKRLPNDFFTKPRPDVGNIKIKKDPDDEIIPFKWSKEVLQGKVKIIVDLPKKTI